MTRADNRHPLLAKLLEQVGGPRLGEIVQAFEGARDEEPAAAISKTIGQIFERTVEELPREDRAD